jgi:peptidoglycan hydrolase-like protein with peptidoglycan-binding domain
MRLLAIVILVLVLAAPALAAGNPDVAALQVALRAHLVYGGTIDGVRGPETDAAVRALQRRAGLAVDGVVVP